MLEIVEPQGDGSGSEVESDPVAFAPIQTELDVGEVGRFVDDPHRSPPHRVAADGAFVPLTDDARTARETELAVEMGFLRVRAERSSPPSSTSRRHSRHFPCFTQEVGTWIPIRSAHSKSVAPVGDWRLSMVDE